MYESNSTAVTQQCVAAKKMLNVISGIGEQQEEIKSYVEEINAKLYGTTVDSSKCGEKKQRNDGYFSFLEEISSRNEGIIKTLHEINERL